MTLLPYWDKLTQTHKTISENPSFPFIFMNEKRAEVREKFPTWGIGQIGKELGRLWGELSDEEREGCTKETKEAKYIEWWWTRCIHATDDGR